MTDWDPKAYLNFKNERTQPSIDLISRIKLESPKNIIDIGCGPGNSTMALNLRWPNASITGLDSSKAMIDQAKQEHPQHTWVLADASALDTDISYDLVFSNATLQWIPEHEKLINSLFKIVNNNGSLAVQIPMFHKMPISKAIRSVANDAKWKKHTNNCESLFTYHDAGYYYDLLNKLTGKIEIWETAYCHILPSHPALINFIRSAGLRPYLDSLSNDEDRKAFLNEMLEECKSYYPILADGKVLFPFIRLFFIAQK